MAKKSGHSIASPEHITTIDVSSEMETSFLEYAYSVIYSRALPDARDGLKPVQRRILFQMAQMGLRPERGHVKCARVVGEVMGKLHPHGDSAIYDALVRLSQDFTLRLPLVDGHGNFGSLDNGPAAARYTEARLAPAALAMTADLDADVVDLVPNYDNQFMQPEVLPAAIPNLLVNGASGIAVGMATNMAPHNLREVISAAQHLIEHPDATLDELMQFVPGPDLPGGGRIVGLSGIRDAYETGRGSFRIRATARIENITARRRGIIVTELPYMVGPERVIDRIKDAVNNKKLQGISAVNDLTDRHHGMQLVIEVKNSFKPEAVLEQLYRYTPLEDSFGINNVALVDGEPRTLGLKELLSVFVDHRVNVTRRRTEFYLKKHQDRLHLVEGLLIAILDIDEVIQVIRASDDADTARQRLILAFDLTEPQADYILELRLRRLTKFSRLELETEREQLLADIAECERILGDPQVLRGVVSSELAKVAADHGDDRRTVLLEAQSAPSTKKVETSDLQVPDTPIWVGLSATGLIARMPQAPSVSGPRTSHDALSHVISATNHEEIGVVFSNGEVTKLTALDAPAIPPTQHAPSLAGGVPLADLVETPQGSRIIGIVSLGEEKFITLATKQGVIKRVNPDWPTRASSWPLMRLAEGDEVVSVGMSSDADTLVLVTSQAQLLRFPASVVRPQGRSGGGVAGIRIPDDAELVYFAAVSDPDDVLVLTVAGNSAALPGTETGSAKLTPLAEFPIKGRAGAGVRAHRFLKGEDVLQLAAITHDSPRAVGSAGQPVDLPPRDPRRDGSGVALKNRVLGAS